MRRLLHLARVACFAAAIVAGAASAFGLMLEKSVDELTTEADTIVVGSVAHQQSAWSEGGGEIHTDVTLLVERIVAGAADRELTFRIAGGQVGDIRMSTSDDPSFELGDRVVVFLDSSQKPPRLVGLEQGAVRIRGDRVQRRGREASLPDFVGQVEESRRRAR
jgi:hypothetical protein